MTDPDKKALDLMAITNNKNQSLAVIRFISKDCCENKKEYWAKVYVETEAL